jgi:thioredoxin 1
MVELKYFSADWCGPCKQQKPIVNDLEEERDDLTVERHDVDEEQDLANKFNVRSVPTIVVLNDGDIVTVFSGFTQKNDLVEAIEGAEANGTAPL